MALDMNRRPEEAERGKANFHRAVGELANDPKNPGLSRRDFMKGLIAAGAVVPVSAAAYFGYQKNFGGGGKPDRPVRAALIGAGDEGGVLIGEHNPEYIRFVAVVDARPTNKERIFTGDMEDVTDKDGKVVKEANGETKRKWKGSIRKGFDHIPAYGGKEEARKSIKVFDSYEELFRDHASEFEAVVIALPLNLHAHAAVYALDHGKHVLCEKLMGWSISECKKMIAKAKETGLILAIGHQRHYSLLYAHAVEVLKSGAIGDVHHIRALWHRNNAKLVKAKDGTLKIKDGWYPEIPKEDEDALKDKVGKLYPAGCFNNMDELIRWRIKQRSGGGLMAELGSHQLDACSIFLEALAGKGSKENGPHRPTWAEFLAWEEHEKLHPLAVSGVGTRCSQKNWECDDHVFCSFEFPGKNYWKDGKQWGEVQDANDVVVVTYSSVNTNSFEPYGECVMGTAGTMVVDSEQSVMLYPDLGNPAGNRNVSIVVTTSGGKPALESSGSSPPGGSLPAAAAQQVGQTALGSPISRGYREEMEDFAYCIRTWESNKGEDRPLPRCHGQVAMGDAILALTANEAMGKRKRVEFHKEWFDPTNLDPAAGFPDAEKVGKGLIA